MEFLMHRTRHTGMFRLARWILLAGTLLAATGCLFEPREPEFPATGEQIHKDADKVVKMTIAKALKDSVNG